MSSYLDTRLSDNLDRFKLVQTVQCCCLNRHSADYKKFPFSKSLIINFEKWLWPQWNVQDSEDRHDYMMTSSNGNIFRITGPLCGEFTGERWIPRTNGQWRRTLIFSLISAWINGWVNNCEAGYLRRHHVHNWRHYSEWSLLSFPSRHDVFRNYYTNGIHLELKLKYPSPIKLALTLVCESETISTNTIVPIESDLDKDCLIVRMSLNRSCLVT